MKRRLEDVAHIETVCFDRVFDVQGKSFSFDSAGTRQYSVRFDGGDVPLEGSRYAVALVEEGNWQKIIGWRDLSTSNVFLRQSAWDVAMAQAWILYWFAPFFMIGAWLFIGWWAALVVLALALSAAGYAVRHASQRNRLVDQALRDVPPAAPPGSGPIVPKAFRLEATGWLLNFLRI